MTVGEQLGDNACDREVVPTPRRCVPSGLATGCVIPTLPAKNALSGHHEGSELFGVGRVVAEDRARDIQPSTRCPHRQFRGEVPQRSVVTQPAKGQGERNW